MRDTSDFKKKAFIFCGLILVTITLTLGVLLGSRQSTQVVRLKMIPYRLSPIAFKNNASFTGKSITQNYIFKTRFTELNIEDCHFDGSFFNDVEFLNLNLSHCNISNNVFIDTNFTNTSLPSNFKVSNKCINCRF